MTVAKAESLKWTRICTRCGKKMVGVASNKKLCDSCLRIRQIEHDRKKAQNNKLEVVERAKPKHAPEDSLQNDVREAERLGVSYGKYRAWKGGPAYTIGPMRTSTGSGAASDFLEQMEVRTNDDLLVEASGR